MEFYKGNDPFPSLEELSFCSMKEWVHWDPSDDDHDDVVIAGKSLFPHLEKLKLKNCPRLKGALPAHLPSLKQLSMDACRSLMELNGCYPQLASLEVIRCGPRMVNSCLIDNKFRVFTSLQKLSLGDCDCVRSFPVEGSLPPSLATLIIENFAELKKLEGTVLHSLNCLEELGIIDGPLLEALPDKEELPGSLTQLLPKNLVSLKTLDGIGLQNLTSLKNLIISCCPKLETLPDEGLPRSLTALALFQLENLRTLDGVGLQNLTSLFQLYITDCPKLEALPEEGLPCSLQILRLGRNHPKLIEQCQKDTGPDWPKIAHVPDVEIW